MKRYGLYIIVGALTDINLAANDTACAVGLCPISTYTLFDGNTIIDEVTESSIVQNDNIIREILAKHKLSTTEVDIIGGIN